MLQYHRECDELDIINENDISDTTGLTKGTEVSEVVSMMCMWCRFQTQGFTPHRRAAAQVGCQRCFQVSGFFTERGRAGCPERR